MTLLCKVLNYLNFAFHPWMRLAPSSLLFDAPHRLFCFGFIQQAGKKDASLSSTCGRYRLPTADSYRVCYSPVSIAACFSLPVRIVCYRPQLWVTRQMTINLMRKLKTIVAKQHVQNLQGQPLLELRRVLSLKSCKPEEYELWLKG